MLPESVKLGITTPGTKNDCTGAHFVMEEYLPQLIGTLSVNAASISSSNWINIQYMDVRVSSVSRTTIIYN